MSGRRSLPQSKYGFTTTPLAMYGAESRSDISSGLSKSYAYSDGCHSMSESTARAYGSSSSLCGLQRRPRYGSYGPYTR